MIFIPFFIVFSLIFGFVVTIIVRATKGVAKGIKSAIDASEFKQDNFNNTQTIANNTPEYVFCEYCGTKQLINQIKCSSCGAKITKK